MAKFNHALVLGAGMAGMLAAAAFAEHADTITVVDRDRLPRGPEDRKGVPHGRHIHGLLPRGQEAIEELLPGFSDEVLAGGGRFLGVPDQFLMGFPGGYFAPHQTGVRAIDARRALLDWVVRRRLLERPSVQFVESTDIIGLAGTPARVTGAVVRDRATRQQREIPADVVVAAPGRGGSAMNWLAELGLPPVDEEKLDVGVVYATRLYRTPPEAWRLDLAYLLRENFLNPTVGIAAAFGCASPKIVEGFLCRFRLGVGFPDLVVDG